MIIKKEYTLNETILTFYNTISILYYNWCDVFPKEISDKIEDLIKALTECLEKNYLDLDIADEKLIKRITFYYNEKIKQ